MREKIRRTLLLALVLCFCLSAVGAVEVVPEGQAVQRALAALNMDPVALTPLSDITVNTSANGCYVNSVTWYDSNGDPVSGGAFDTNTYHVEIQLGTLDGFYFAENVAGYINNSECSIVRDPSGTLVTLSRDYVPAIWAATIYNHPKSTTVDPGHWADFWVSGVNVAKYEWRLESPSGTKLALEDIQTVFPNVPIPENGNDTLIINQVPPEMDGWKVICTFISAADITRTDSNPATITVNGAKATPTPTPEPTPSPTPTATPEPTPTPTPEHTHEFATVWSKDADSHWHACSCGERADEAPHSMEWTETVPATSRAKGEEQGVCSVCGYTEVRSTEFDGGNGEAGGLNLGTFRVVLFVVAALVAVGTLTIVILSIRDNSRRRRRGRH